MKKIVYIMSDNRSGSTLLDQLLGAHSRIVSLGEVHHLPAYALQDRSLYNPVHPLHCSCGATIEECPFWLGVASKLERHFATLELKLRYLQRPLLTPSQGNSSGRMAARIARRYPRVFAEPLASTIFNACTVAKDSFDLFDAIFSTSGADFLVDSSKDPFRFRALYDHQPERMLGIVLGRDYRGTVYSKLKRGRELKKSAREWTARMTQMKVLTHGIPFTRCIRVRYEDLCKDPRGELERICNFIGVAFSDAILTRPIADVHHLGGSPSKFDLSRSKIVLDQAYMHAFTEQEQATMRKIVRSVALDWGYI